MEINPALLSPDVKTFESALTAFHVLVERTMDDSIAAIDLLDKNQTLGSSEIARRAMLLVGQALLSEADAAKLISAAARWQPAVKLSIQASLTPEQRQRIYAPKVESGNPASPPARSLVLPGEFIQLVSVPAAAVPKGEDFKSVLLLGSADAHEANSRFLEKSEFSAIRVSAPDKLESALGSGICGVIVDGSWWAAIPPDQHESSLRRILSFSNFVWLKIDHTNLRAEIITNFLKLCQVCRFRDPLMTEIGFGVPSRLDQVDIQRLNDAADHLSASERISFHPSEIKEDEAVILLAAVQKRRSGKGAFIPVEIERVDTSVVHGGMSSAKILLLKPNDNSAPFVAKIDDHSSLDKEMLRFKTFVEAWQPQLQPELYIHNGVAVMFLAMIDEGGEQDKRAPTLLDRINSLGYSERVPSPKNCPTLNDLKHTVKRAVERLVLLNRTPCPTTTITNSCWIKVEPLVELKKNNVEFEILESGSRIEVLAIAETARAQVERLNGKAISHGDVHSRNVLVRLDREPLFIDFAYSGPGHPAFDLVRLEASLLYTHFRMAESEDQMVKCFHNVFTTNMSFDELQRAHPALMASKASNLAIYASLETRRAALSVLQSYGGNEKDYFSMKMVIACQSLIIPGFQEVAVRASIRTLSKILSQL